METEKCRICGASVKTENIKRHYSRAHSSPLGQNIPPSPRVIGSRGRRSRRRLWVVLAGIILVSVIGFAVFGGSGPFSQILPNTSSPFTVELSPSFLSFKGPGVSNFQVTVKSTDDATATLGLGGQSFPIGTRVDFDSGTVTVSKLNPAVVQATLVLQQHVSLGRQSLEVVVTTESKPVIAKLDFEVTFPSDPRKVYLVANQSGWNSTSPSGVNPTINVHIGELFELVVETVPDPSDIHHYVSIYPPRTPPSRVDEFGSTDYYARSGLAHTYPETSGIVFVFGTTGIFPYFCDSHPDTMHGVIEVSP